MKYGDLYLKFPHFFFTPHSKLQKDFSNHRHSGHTNLCTQNRNLLVDVITRQVKNYHSPKPKDRRLGFKILFFNIKASTISTIV